MPERAIYYPWIAPPNRALLASGILYWDEMYTIVPQSITNPYQTPETRAAHDYGFLRPNFVGPDAPEVVRASGEFLQDLDRYAIVQDRRSATRWSGRMRPLRKVRIHPDKLSHRFGDGLFGHKTQSEHRGFQGVPEDIGLPYMARLCAVIAEARRWTPLTDRRASQRTFLDRSVELEWNHRMREAETAIATGSLDTIRMSPTTPLGELWAFREAHHEELRRYRTAIRNFARQIAAATGGDELVRAAEQVVEDEILPAEEEVAGRLRDAGFNWRLSALEITLMGAATLLADATAGLGAALATAGVGLTFTACRKRAERDRERQAPMTYLYEARRRFGVTGSND